MSALTDLRGVPLGELDGKDIGDVLESILGEGPAVPVAAFNSAI